MTKQTFRAIKYVPTESEKKIIKFYEVQWLLHSRVPTVDEVSQYTGLNHTTINYSLKNRKCVRDALKNRGIPWEQHSQTELTNSQVAAAALIMNFADTRTINQKLDALGISPTQYYAWLKDPQFRTLVDSMAEQNKVNIKPAAIAEYTRLVHSGDWQAIKHYMDVTGAMRDENSLPSSEVLITMLIEIIQRHVKDGKIIAAIAQDIKNVTQNRTLEVEPPQEITADFVDNDTELAMAKKMLGI